MKVLVVGAGGVIGKAVAEALVAKGHEVVAASRQGAVRVDIADPESIRSMYAAVGKLGAVVCCAGNAAFRPLLQLSDEDLQSSLKDKLLGQVNLVRFGVESVSDGGIFLLTAGIFSQRPWPATSAIAMVNGALESFVRGAALDLPRGIRIGAISPPFIKETADKMGIQGGTLTAADNALAYVEALESGITGQVVYPGT